MTTPEEKIDAIRAYWREKKQAQRAAKKTIGFEPHITEFQRCSLCGEWHPTYYILASGHNGRVSLDSYHSKESILSFVRGIDAALPKPAAFLDHAHATALCIKNLMDETGIDETTAKNQAEVLIRDDSYRNKLIQFHHDKTKADAVNERNLKMCMRSRMELYNESERWARANCMVILEDPLYRHFPEGLVKDPQGRYDLIGDVLVPIEICKDLDISLVKNPTIKALQVCFADKMKKNPDLDPAVAMQQCMNELESKGYGEPEKPVVGDLFGKSAAEIRAMSKRKQDPSFTVGDLYGLTPKQIRRMQKHGWDQDDNAAFEACVKDKMEKEGMTRDEAEKACEALSGKSADTKRELAGDIHGQI